MPRIKKIPKRKSFERITEYDDPDESCLDDEEVRRLERELEYLRRQKLQQIRKMRQIENEKRLPHDVPSSSRDYDETVSDQETDGEVVKTRASTRSLVNGLDRAQQRFRFNVKRIEIKYAERERRGLPESHIEMDRYGNFFFPETMAGCHQQSYINRMFQKDAQFGKGSVSAPFNSVDSFDGDLRALKKAQQLDKTFGRQLKNSDDFEKEQMRNQQCSNNSANHQRRISDNCSRYSDDLSDDVFIDENIPRCNLQPNVGRRTTMEEFLLDETECRSEESTSYEGSDEEETEEDEESSDEECKDEKGRIETSTFKHSVSRDEVKKEMVEKSSELSEHSNKKKKTNVKAERDSLTPIRDSQFNVKTEVSTPCSSKKKELNISCIEVKKETVTSLETPQVIIIDDKSMEIFQKPKRNKKITDFLKPIQKTCEKTEVSHNVSTNGQPIEASLSSEKTASFPVSNSQPFDSKDATLTRKSTRIEKKTNDNLVLASSQDDPSELAPSVKPVRKRKLTLKMSESILEKEGCKDPVRSNEKKKNMTEELHRKNNEMQKKAKNPASVNEKKKKENDPGHSQQNVLIKKGKDILTVEKGKKTRKSETEGPSRLKRRSATVASNEPEMKKQRLTESDLISIPSSTAVVVDNVLILAENPQLGQDDDLPKVSDKASTGQSIWNSSEESQMLYDVFRFEMKRITKLRGKCLFGVPLTKLSNHSTMINLWAENLDLAQDEKDQFESDFRRLWAQDKKARGDLKAGYNVRQ